MSFKREGNDASLLGKLRNRRITELLSEDIPEDEAKLLCNGRFTCMVCPSNPIFDTVNMLTVHRNGKKHVSNQQIFNAKKRELNHLIAARKHQQYLKDGSTSIRMAKPNDRSLLTSCPYDPRVKKAKVKIGERKPILDYTGKTSEMVDLDSVKIHNKDKPTVDARNIIYGSTSMISDPFERCLTGPFKHTHQLTDIFKEKAKDPVRIAPYRSKFRSNLSVHKNIQSRSLRGEESTLTGCQSPQNSSIVGSLPSLDGRVPSISSMGVSSKNTSYTTNEAHLTMKPTSQQHSQTSNKSIPAGPGTQAHKLLLSFPPPPPPPPPITSTENCTSSISNSPSASDTMVVNAERLKEQNMVSQKLRQLQGSGWKRDWDGKWIKDKDAEFDSDDEPPDFP